MQLPYSEELNIGYLSRLFNNTSNIGSTKVFEAKDIEESKEQFFTEKKNIYYELTTILPDVDKFLAQSDYMDGTEGSGRAEDKISIMEIQLEDIVNRK